jgi:TRAP-type uncharacterized transport system fused permease subunit
MVIAGLALLCSLFQLWIASSLLFVLGFGVFNDTETLAIHLAFALLLAFLAYPAFRTSPRERLRLLGIALGLIAAASAACIGIPLLLEATRRALGSPLSIIALLL